MIHIGACQQIIVSRRAVRLGRLTRGVVRQWLHWAQDTLPDPLPSILDVFDHLDADSQALLAEQAIDSVEERHNLSSPLLSSLWASQEGQTHLLALLILSQEKLAPDEAKGIAEAAWDEHGEAKVASWISRANGRSLPSETEAEERVYREAGLFPSTETNSEQSSLKQKYQAATGVDWESIDRSLFQNCYLSPLEADQLTLSELSVIASKEKEELSMGEAIRRAALYGKLTPKQKLQVALYRAGV